MTREETRAAVRASARCGDVSPLRLRRPLPLELRAAYDRQVARAARQRRWLSIWRRTMARDAFVFAVAGVVLACALLLDRCRH